MICGVEGVGSLRHILHLLGCNAHRETRGEEEGVDGDSVGLLWQEGNEEWGREFIICLLVFFFLLPSSPISSLFPSSSKHYTSPPRITLPLEKYNKMVNPAQIILVSQMSAVAYYAILVWDWIISLSKEYQLIWKTDWSVYKVLYVINRYWTLLALAFSLWAYTANIDGATCSEVVNLVVCPVSSCSCRIYWP